MNTIGLIRRKLKPRPRWELWVAVAAAVAFVIWVLT